MDDCLHGIGSAWCSVCNKSPDAGSSRLQSSGFHGSETKQDVLDDICRILGIPKRAVSVGSSLPSDVFSVAARQAGVSNGSMPEVCEAIVLKAGLTWSSSFDSRGSFSGGGSTVTLEGIQAMRKALAKLLGSP